MAVNIEKLFQRIISNETRSATFLLEAIEKNQIAGFDYIEFKQSVENMLNMNIDMETALKSTISTAGTLGVDWEKIEASMQHYLKVLDRERKSFEDALERRRQKNVKQLQQAVDRNKQIIEELKVKERQIQEKIQALSASISNADQQLKDEQAKQQATSEEFNTTLQSLVKLIQDDMDLYREHLSTHNE